MRKEFEYLLDIKVLFFFLRISLFVNLNTNNPSIRRDKTYLIKYKWTILLDINIRQALEAIVNEIWNFSHLGFKKVSQS
jgi:hypothetical protein